MSRVTPLLRFLRGLTKPEREVFAAAVGTTTNYLEQLAGQPKPNPNLRMALAIRDESRRIAKHAKVPVVPLTLEDLLIGKTPDTDD